MLLCALGGVLVGNKWAILLCLCYVSIVLVLIGLICVIVFDAVVEFLLDWFLSFESMFKVIFCSFLVLLFLCPAPLKLAWGL